MIPSLSRKLRLVRLALLWERALPALLLALGLAALLVALALLEVPARLPFWLHAALAPAFALGVAWSLRRILRTPIPDPAQVARRLEEDSGVGHRPLSALSDRLALGDPLLWQAHRQRMEHAARSLRPGWPRPVMAARDPWGLRFMPWLLLLVALAGNPLSPRQALLAALDPWSARPPLASESLEVWLVPPAYTGLGQMALKPGGGAILVPDGSLARMATSWRGWGGGALSAGGETAAVGADGRAEIALKGAPSPDMRLDMRLDVRLGLRLAASWPVEIRPDSPPRLEAPRLLADPLGRLAIEVEGSDDYGLAAAWVEIRPAEGEGHNPLRLDFVLPGQRPTDARLALRVDLAGHEWAGREVVVTPGAEDSIGQRSSGPQGRVALPEREFRHPVARQLVAWRRQLSAAPRLGPAIAGEMDGLLDAPDSFGGDLRAYLALTMTRQLLMRPAFPGEEMRELLWYAATRIEDGGLPAAAQALEEARARLERALAGGEDGQSLGRLLDQLEMALGKWLDALADATPATEAGPDQAMAAHDLDQMLEELRALAESGDLKAVRQRLEELARLLDALEQARRDPAPADSASAQALRQLQTLAEQQRELLDHSFNHQPSASARAEKEEARRAEERQRGLGQELEKLNRSLLSPVESLARAKQAMDEAESSLAEGNWEETAEAQTQALAGLREGARQMAERMQAASGKGAPQPGRRDPFGRSLGKGGMPGDDGRTKLPGQGETQRAREILQELRRRAGESGRGEPEREYLRRLLRPF